jgi:hypothetical protein
MFYAICLPNDELPLPSQSELNPLMMKLIPPAWHNSGKPIPFFSVSESIGIREVVHEVGYCGNFIYYCTVVT